MKKHIIVLLAVLIALAACQTQKPESVVQALEEASNAGDLERAISLFSENAVVKILPSPPGPPGAFSGADEIQDWIGANMALNAQVGVEVLEVSGNTVSTRTEFADDDIRSMGIAPLAGNEEYIVEDGKITSLTFTFTDESLAEMQAAMRISQGITESSLSGDWVGSIFIQFSSDGTFAAAEAAHLFAEAPLDYGEYVLLGSTLTFNSADDSITCPGVNGSYDLSFTEEGRLLFTLLEDACGGRRAGATGGTFGSIGS